MVDHDVIVVGAGPAGSTAARRLALSGLRVAVLDREKFPRVKPCAGAIRWRVTQTLGFDVRPLLHRRISGFSIYAPQGFRVDCIPEDRTRPGYTIMRDEFDAFLLKKAAEAGANVQEGKEVTGVSQEPASVQVVTSSGEKLSGRYLIAADGINSTAAKSLGFYEAWDGATAMVGIEVEAEVGQQKVRDICADPTGHDAEVFFFNFGDVPHGYTWCFPKRTILSLGICCRQDKAKNIRAIFDNWYAKFIAEHQLSPHIVSETSARFPVVPRKPLVIGRALLAGDAAGFVDAFTGEGIPYAIDSGIYAADAVVSAARQDQPAELRKYESVCEKTVLKDLAVSDSLAKMFYKSRKNMETFCRFLHEDKYASYLIAASIGGLLPMSTVKTKLTMRMLRKRPLDAMSMMA